MSRVFSNLLAVAIALLLGACATTSSPLDRVAIAATARSFSPAATPVEPAYQSQDLASVAASPTPSGAAASAEEGASAGAAPTLVPLRTALVGSGVCDCPYDVKTNGEACGGASAWSQPGGRAPRCYASDPQLPGTSPECSESGSCFGDISVAIGLPRTTFVHGYHRSNGTYVRSYFRSR